MPHLNAIKLRAFSFGAFPPQNGGKCRASDKRGAPRVSGVGREVPEEDKNANTKNTAYQIRICELLELSSSVSLTLASFPDRGSLYAATPGCFDCANAPLNMTVKI